MLRRVAVLTVLAVAAGVLTPVAAHAAPGAGVIHTIRNIGGESARSKQPYPRVDVCLDADTNTIGRNGTKVQLWRCNDTTQQDWYYQPVTSSDGVIKNTRAGSGYCLDANVHELGSNGTSITLWSCNGSAQQRWSGVDTRTIRNVAAGVGFCLDADANAIGSDGTKITLWGCNSRVQQQWYLSLPYTRTCKNYAITRAGQWQFVANAGQGIHVDIVNASLGAVSVAAQELGTTIYNGSLLPEQQTTFHWASWGTEPFGHELVFFVNGVNIGTINVTVRSYIC
ncbi:RICIN domain-containing protein [Dactylosporangium sp. CA-092794]|uniref:RICIN domain-containing protein n=1 Tax=Dactylosporangium sp. CA-092794 TaxID=3239929 RepID=UPI003D8CD4EA